MATTPSSAVAAAAAAGSALTNPSAAARLDAPSQQQQRSGLLDLEKELSCSICTDTLFQPLTLLDCLHTFCGACLKLWFAWQASQADADSDSEDSRLMNPYTCPSCRAHVRGTRPDAKITTLLDMYLAANPGKGKNEEEKAEQREKYAPGDDVVPRLGEHIEDVRMARELREMNLREAERARRQQVYQRGTRHEGGRRGGDVERNRERAQQLGHQHSLRSLISMDDLTREEMEEAIMQQIIEEGLLNGIELSNLTNEQEDELGERIAEAYRRRLRARRRDSPSRDGRRDSSRRREDASGRSDSSPQPPPRRESSEQTSGSPARSSDRSPRRETARVHSRSTSDTQVPSRPDARPPTQRDDLLQARPADSRQRRRSSDTRRPAQSQPETGRATSELGPRSNSSEQQPQQQQQQQQQQQSQQRRSYRTGSGAGAEVTMHRPVLRDSPQTRSPASGSPAQSPPQSPPATGISSPRTNSLTASAMAPNVTPMEHMANQHPSLVANVSYGAGTQVTAPSSHRRVDSFSNTIPGISRLQGHGYAEPVINCDRCGKQGIQYQLHYNCQSCRNGRYNICSHCYKTGQGCLVWYGFGHTAMIRYQKKGAPTPELPHSLLGTRYRRPERDELVNVSPDGKLLAKEPAQRRRRVGAFCYVCESYAEDFFYKCDSCNDGEWGFCKNCVNRGRCCSHALLPLAWVSSNRYKSSSSDTARGVQASFAQYANPPIQPFPPSSSGTSRQYRPLSVSTTCDRCRSSISPSQARYHCSRCNDGWLEYCAPCYSQLQDNGAVAPQDGANGWRRCPRGHRMTVAVFEDTETGQRRKVLNQLVGGHFLLDRPENGGGGGGGGGSDNNGGGANATNPGTVLTPRTDERRYKWNEGETGHSTTLSRPHTSETDASGGGGGGGSSNNNSSGGNTGAGRGRKFPPDGGVGKRCWARWSWIPKEGVEDELMFPRGAEVFEVLDVTDEWCEGSYAGAKGVFPTSYVKTLDVVTM